MNLFTIKEYLGSFRELEEKYNYLLEAYEKTEINEWVWNCCKKSISIQAEELLKTKVIGLGGLLFIEDLEYAKKTLKHFISEIDSHNLKESSK